MRTANGMQGAGDNERFRASRAEAIDRLERTFRAERIADGAIEPLPGLRLRRATIPTEPVHGLSYPAVCVIAQGSKEVLIGDGRYFYDTSQYLITTAEMPIVSRITVASPEEPYFSIVVALDPAEVSAVLVESDHPTTRASGSVKAIDVSLLDVELLDAMLRFVRLLDAPSEARFLAPMIQREIIYRLLRGDQGARLRSLTVAGGSSHRVAQAIEWLRRNYDRPLRIDDLAQDLGMSVSSFHHHFKSVTSMSPLQFQKQLRLQEARRLMLGEYLDATSAGFRVGYDDVSHFSREYKRQFGEPPLRDVQRLRAAATPDRVAF